MIVALAWMAAAMCWRWATGRPVSWLLVLTLGMMTIKTGFTLATGNTFVYFVQPVFTDVLVATVFLGSLCTSRPVVARLARTSTRWTGRLPHDPGYRLFRRLTLLWGLVVLVKGGVTVWPWSRCRRSTSCWSRAVRYSSSR